MSNDGSFTSSLPKYVSRLCDRHRTPTPLFLHKTALRTLETRTSGELASGYEMDEATAGGRLGRVQGIQRTRDFSRNTSPSQCYGVLLRLPPSRLRELYLYQLLKSKGRTSIGSFVLIFQPIVTSLAHPHYFHILVMKTAFCEYNPILHQTPTQTGASHASPKLADFSQARETASTTPYTECVNEVTSRTGSLAPA